MRGVSFLILLFSFNFVFADEVGLLSISSKEVTQGDIVTLKIIDSRPLSYYLQYKNKRIGQLLYAIDSYEKDNEIYLEAVISPMGPKEKLPKLNDEFIIKGLNFSPSKQKPIMDFITLNIPIEIKRKTSFWLGLFFFIALFSFVGWWFYTKETRAKKKKNKLIREKKISELDKILQKATSKDDFAELYLKREEILNFFEIDEQNFEKLMILIDEIQYQQEWPIEKFNIIKKKFDGIKNNLKVKSGV